MGSSSSPKQRRPKRSAAINTGNNLLYLLLGVLLALILVSGIMSELALRALVVRRRLPTRAQVGRPHLVEI